MLWSVRKRLHCLHQQKIWQWGGGAERCGVICEHPSHLDELCAAPEITAEIFSTLLLHGVWATDLVLPWLRRWMRQVHTLQWHHRWLENPQEIGQAPSLRVTAVTALPRGHPKLGAGNWQSYTCFSTQPAWAVPFTSLPCSQELQAMLTTLGGAEGSPVGYTDLLQDVVPAFPMIQVSSLCYLGPLLLPVQCREIK